MLTIQKIRNQKNIILINLSLFLMPWLVPGQWHLVMCPIYFFIVSLQGYSPLSCFEISTKLYILCLILWYLLSLYLPIQITYLITAKKYPEIFSLKSISIKFFYYIFFSAVFQMGIFWPFFMGTGEYYTENTCVIFIRLLVSIFIAWACYKNIDNFKKLFTREFWDLKIIMMACLRFIGLSTLSGLMLYGISLILEYISKLF